MSIRTAAPAPADGVVAILAKRGRFLVAERAFPQRAPLGGDREDGAGPRGRASGRGGRAPSQIVVDGASARQRSGARVGDLVLVRVPGRGHPRARIERVIGRPDVARDVIEALMLDRGLARAFPLEVEHEARSVGARQSEPGGTGGVAPRRDLRDLPTLTIDPASARDFDDAISAEALEGDRARVWVHIADVCAYVEPGTALDREARRRATSVYVPGAVEPMLPAALSEDACSLRPGADRLAVTAELELAGAVVERAAFYRSIIRSDARLDYDQVDRVFAGSERAVDPWAAPLAVARRVAAALGDLRRRTGALTLDAPEPEIEIDRDGHVARIGGREQTESHGLIEQLMVAANSAVASLLAERRVPCLYRVHEQPDPARIERLVEQLASLDVPTPPLPRHLAPSQAAELVAEISARVDQYVRGRGGRGRMAFTSLVLRSLMQAYYTPRNLGHAGLGLTHYCHFTSPIRRYPDIVCHRALLSVVAGGPAPRSSGMKELGEWTSDRERGAMVIERDADDVARCFALERELYERGWDAVFEGEVTGLIGAGAFVAFPDGAGAPGYEGMLPVRRMQDDWWDLNEEGTIFHGSRTGGVLRLGDAIAVRVGNVDTLRGRVDLLPVDRAGEEAAGRVPRPRGRRGSR